MGMGTIGGGASAYIVGGHHHGVDVDGIDGADVERNTVNANGANANGTTTTGLLLDGGAAQHQGSQTFSSKMKQDNENLETINIHWGREPGGLLARASSSSSSESLISHPSLLWNNFNKNVSNPTSSTESAASYNASFRPSAAQVDAGGAPGSSGGPPSSAGGGASFTVSSSGSVVLSRSRASSEAGGSTTPVGGAGGDIISLGGASRLFLPHGGLPQIQEGGGINFDAASSRRDSTAAGSTTPGGAAEGAAPASGALLPSGDAANANQHFYAATPSSTSGDTRNLINLAGTTGGPSTGIISARPPTSPPLNVDEQRQILSDQQQQQLFLGQPPGGSFSSPDFFTEQFPPIGNTNTTNSTQAEQQAEQQHQYQSATSSTSNNAGAAGIIPPHQQQGQHAPHLQGVGDPHVSHHMNSSQVQNTYQHLSSMYRQEFRDFARAELRRSRSARRVSQDGNPWADEAMNSPETDRRRFSKDVSIHMERDHFGGMAMGMHMHHEGSMPVQQHQGEQYSYGNAHIGQQQGLHHPQVQHPHPRDQSCDHGSASFQNHHIGTTGIPPAQHQSHQLQRDIASPRTTTAGFHPPLDAISETNVHGHQTAQEGNVGGVALAGGVSSPIQYPFPSMPTDDSWLLPGSGETHSGSTLSSGANISHPRSLSGTSWSSSMLETRHARTMSEMTTGSQADYMNPDQTIIIWDWDDTLHPSYWVKSLGLTVHDEVPKQIQGLLAELAVISENAIRASLKLGRVVIITNAETGWAQLSCKRWLPGLWPFLQDMTVISARSTFEPKGVESPAGWKTHAFKEVIEAFYSRYPNQRWKNVLAMGDGRADREALHRVTEEKLSEGCRQKNVKFLVRPSLDVLKKQLLLLTDVLESIVIADDHIDIRICEDHLLEAEAAQMKKGDDEQQGAGAHDQQGQQAGDPGGGRGHTMSTSQHQGGARENEEEEKGPDGVMPTELPSDLEMKGPDGVMPDTIPDIVPWNTEAQPFVMNVVEAGNSAAAPQVIHQQSGGAVPVSMDVDPAV
ncbi:unnamed protein product [Amoebophrya sp. A25]|nr:unnamed protein product [Amoebophrya sp. A25]|eukprot:GSA25T00012945001.1